MLLFLWILNFFEIWTGIREWQKLIRINRNRQELKEINEQGLYLFMVVPIIWGDKTVPIGFWPRGFADAVLGTAYLLLLLLENFFEFHEKSGHSLHWQQVFPENSGNHCSVSTKIVECNACPPNSWKSLLLIRPSFLEKKNRKIL